MCSLHALWYVCVVYVICMYGIECGMYVRSVLHIHILQPVCMLCIYSVVFGGVCVVCLVFSCIYGLSDKAVFKDSLTGISSSAIGHGAHVSFRSLVLHSSLPCKHVSVTDTSVRTREV